MTGDDNQEAVVLSEHLECQWEQNDTLGTRFTRVEDGEGSNEETLLEIGL